MFSIEQVLNFSSYPRCLGESFRYRDLSLSISLLFAMVFFKLQHDNRPTVKIHDNAEQQRSLETMNAGQQ
jgi:hypothetical protein